MSVCVVFGGSGFIGMHLANHLLSTQRFGQVHLADIKQPPSLPRVLLLRRLMSVDRFLRPSSQRRRIGFSILRLFTVNRATSHTSASILTLPPDATYAHMLKPLAAAASISPAASACLGRRQGQRCRTRASARLLGTAAPSFRPNRSINRGSAVVLIAGLSSVAPASSTEQVIPGISYA